MLPYLYVWLASFLVDLVPFFWPPAWPVMVFFQIHFHLNVWLVVTIGVIGCTLGRYILSVYIPALSRLVISPEKNEDVAFVGQKLAESGWKVQLFVFLYTLMPLPSTPLFTAAGMAKIKPRHVLPAFFVGKFLSDMGMVLIGRSTADNIQNLLYGDYFRKSIMGALGGLIIVFLFLCIDWHELLRRHKLRFNFNILKRENPRWRRVRERAHPVNWIHRQYDRFTSIRRK